MSRFSAELGGVVEAGEKSAVGVLVRVEFCRADGKWHRYPECPEVGTLDEALRIVDEDACGCFFG